MNRYLEKFREVPLGVPLRSVLTIEWVMAVQDAIRALAQGENIDLQGGLVRGPGDGKVSIGTRREKRRSRGGGGAAPVTPPLYLVSSRPSYVPEGTVIAAGYTGTWLTWGFCNDVLPTNWATRIDSVLVGTYIKYFKLKVNLVAGANLKISSCEWEAWATADEKEDAPWGAEGGRPNFIYLTLGTLYVNDGVPTLVNSGGGSLMVAEHLSNITQNGALGFTYNRSISYTRLTY